MTPHVYVRERVSKRAWMVPIDLKKGSDGLAGMISVGNAIDLI